MEIKHVRVEEDNTVTVEWNMPMEEYKALLMDAEAEVELVGQKALPETTGERGFLTQWAETEYLVNI